MKRKERQYRISCFEKIETHVANAPAKHYAPRTQAKSDEIFDKLKRKVGSGQYARIIQHQGNLRRDRFKIVRQCTSWTRADELAARHTAFGDFDELLNAKGGFYPSLNIAHEEIKELADLYDEAQAKRRDLRRALRWDDVLTVDEREYIDQ